MDFGLWNKEIRLVYLNNPWAVSLRIQKCRPISCTWLFDHINRQGNYVAHDFKWNQYILKKILKIGVGLDFRDTINPFPCSDICLQLIGFVNGFLVNHFGHHFI